MRFRWNLVCRFLNKFAAKLYKLFPSYLNNISTLPCETWSTLRARATTALSKKVTLKLIPPQLWSPNSPDLNPVDHSVWEYCERRCTKHASRTIWIYRRRNRRMATAMTTWSSWATPFSVAVLVRLGKIPAIRTGWNVYCRDRFEDGDSWTSASVSAAAAAGTERCGGESEPSTADCRSSAYSSVFRRAHDTGLFHVVVLWNRVWSGCLHSGKSVTALKVVDRY